MKLTNEMTRWSKSLRSGTVSSHSVGSLGKSTIKTRSKLVTWRLLVPHNMDPSSVDPARPCNSSYSLPFPPTPSKLPPMEAVVSLQRKGPRHCLYLLYPALFKPYALVSRVCVQKVEARKSQAKDSRQGAGSNQAQRASHSSSPQVRRYSRAMQESSILALDKIASARFSTCLPYTSLCMTPTMRGQSVQIALCEQRRTPKIFHSLQWYDMVYIFF